MYVDTLNVFFQKCPCGTVVQLEPILLTVKCVMLNEVLFGFVLLVVFSWVNLECLWSFLDACFHVLKRYNAKCLKTINYLFILRNKSTVWIGFTNQGHLTVSKCFLVLAFVLMSTKTISLPLHFLKKSIKCSSLRATLPIYFKY